MIDALLLTMLLQAPPPVATAPKFDLVVTETLVWKDTDAADVISHMTSGLGGSYPCVLQRDEESCKRAGIRVAAAIAIAETTKRAFARWRPDLSDDKSFFSQHTAIACSGLMEKQHRAVSIALCASTAYLRISARRHWLSDVVVGAAVGWFVAQQEMRQR